MIFVIKKKILKKLKEFKLNYSYVRFYENNQPVVYIDLSHRTKVRTYLNLFFRIKDVYKEPIVVKFSVLRMIFLAKWFKELDYIYFKKPFSKINKFRTFSHHKKTDFMINYRYKKIYSSSEYKENALPYIMHPTNYLQPESEILPKNIGILISGNFDEKIYNTNVISDNFGLLNRWQIYQEIIKHDMSLLVSGNELISDLNTGKFKASLVLMKWQSGAIPIEKWRYYLSSAKFLFCAPGMTMPMCHNVLEAMSVGVIPILNYQHWLNPSLINMQNCLEYQSVEDIQPVIDLALNIDEITYRRLQTSVVDYYQSYYKIYDLEANRFKKLILLNEDNKDLL